MYKDIDVADNNWFALSEKYFLFESIMLADDERFMLHALALAERGRGSVEPNPMVGALVVSEAGTIVGEGWHERFGGPHAEIHALQHAGEAARGGTLFVSLEPCCHFGKTPPCTDAVLRAGLRRVVVAMPDPFPKVAGGGIAILRDAGLRVDIGIHDSLARRLNAPYLMLTQYGRPWFIAKWAMTLDGKIATKTGDSQWISGAASRAIVHEWRGQVDAILVGRGTVHADDPLLTARPAGPRTAARIVLSASGMLPADCQLVRTARDVPVIVFTQSQAMANLRSWSDAGAEIVPLNAIDPHTIAQELGRRHMTNVFIEGGAGVLGSFHDAGLLDELRVFIAPVLVGGTAAPSPIAGAGIARLTDGTRWDDVEFCSVNPDLLMRCRRLL